MKIRLKRGATLLDPIPVGIREDGEVATIRLVVKSGGVHGLVSGMSGSGKSWGEKPVLITAGALQADQILLDPVKGTQSYRSVAGVLQMYEIDPGRCAKILQRLMTHVLPMRTEHLAREGLNEWDPKRSSLRFLRVHVEEAWKLASKQALTGLGVALRSAGGGLTISLQQPTFDQMDTTLRNQMGYFRCYGLADGDYTQYSLPENVVAAGAKPEKWGNEDPGMHYVVGHGMEIREKVMEVRAFDDGTGENTFASAAQAVAAQLGPMCPVTATGLGELWDNHIAPLDLVRQTGLIVPGPATKQALDHNAVLAAAVQVSDTIANAVDVTPAGERTEPDPLDELEVDMALEQEAAEMDITLAVLGEGGSIIVTDGDEDYELNLDDLDDPDADDAGEPSEAEDLEVFDPGPLPLPFSRPARDEDDGEEAAAELARVRKIGDPPEGAVPREEYHAALDRRLDELIARGEPIERTAFLNVALDCGGWSPASIYKYLNGHPRVEKVGRGWLPVAQNNAQDDEDVA